MKSVTIGCNSVVTLDTKRLQFLAGICQIFKVQKITEKGYN